MREILFRAKGQTSGRWYEGLPTRIDKDVCWIKDDHHDEWICDTSTLCQYTGLTDKSGKKIWENDILHVVEQMSNLVYQGTNLISHPHWINKSNFKVEFTPGSLMNTQRFSNCSSIECEVIGNVFDNPELLEEK